MLLGACSSIGNVRDMNEDSYYISEGVLAVADGMGGHNAGEVASAMAIKYAVDGLNVVSGLPDSIVEAFQAANTAIYDGAQEPSRHGMGTTLTCAVVRDGSLYVGHVGDSRAYLLRAGLMIPMSVDHSVVAELVRSGSLSEEEAKAHPHRHFLTRALGTAPAVPVDVQVRALEAGDIIVLCTDGLTGVASNVEISDIVSRAALPQAAAEALVKLANSRGGPDNVTVVLGKVGA